MSELDDAVMPQVIVQAVQLQPGLINIQYLETRETNDFVSIQRSIVIDSEQIQDEAEELDELLRDIIDKGLLILRNPPQKVRKRRPRRDDLDDDDGDDDGD